MWIHEYAKIHLKLKFHSWNFSRDKEENKQQEESVLYMDKQIAHTLVSKYSSLKPSISS